MPPGSDISCSKRYQCRPDRRTTTPAQRYGSKTTMQLVTSCGYVTYARSRQRLCAVVLTSGNYDLPKAKESTSLLACWRDPMTLRHLTSKPRGLLRDATIVAGLIFLEPNVRFMAVGRAVFLIGFALHFWSKGCLVRNRVVTTCGPYGLIRHPFYLADFLIDEGVYVISGNLWIIALYVVAFSSVYLPGSNSECRRKMVRYSPSSVANPPF